MPKPVNTRYQSLDVWRGVACLMMLLYHGTFYTERTCWLSAPSSWSLGGLLLTGMTYLWVGVPIFFVISGYCIAASIDSLRRKPHSLRDYFARRFRRIYPPLWIMVGLAAVFTLGVGLLGTAGTEYEQLVPLNEFTAWNWLGNLTATECWRSHVGGGDIHYLLRNSWTLGYEEQFYAIAGLLLLCAPRRFFTLAAVLAGLTVAARHGARQFGVETSGFFFDGLWLPFAAGLLVYQSVNYLSRTSVRWAGVLLLAGIAYAVIDRKLSQDTWEQHLDAYMVVAFGFALALIFLKKHDTALASSRFLQPLRWCGKISYSIYLTHFPLVVVLSCALAQTGLKGEWQTLLVTLPLCLVLSLPLAWLFHRAVERRFLNTPQEPGPRRACEPAPSFAPFSL